MNQFEILPTEENIIQTLKDDLLQRNKDLVYFYNLLLAQEMSSSIAIDGRWGSGKTFFVKQSMMLINAKNPTSEMAEEMRTDIIYSLSFPRESKDVEENYELAVYYDAWENDNDTDPILSIVYEIVKQLDMRYNFSDNINVFKLAGSIMEAILGRNIHDIINNLKSEDPLEKIVRERNLYENIKNFFLRY